MAILESHRKPLRLLAFISIDLPEALRSGIPVNLFDLEGYFDHVFLIGMAGAGSQEEIRFSPTVTGVHWPLLPGPSRFPRLTKIRRLFQCIQYAIRVIRKENVDVVLAQDPFLRGPMALAAARLTGRPFVMHVIQNYDTSSRAAQGMAFPPLLFPWIERALERWIYRKADIVMGGWNHYKDYALSKGAALQKTFALRPLPAAVHWTRPEKRRNLKSELGDAGRKVLLYVGRLHPVKYATDLIEMMRIVAERRSDVVLWLVGNGPLHASMEARARELGLADRLRFLGEKTQEELVHLYGSADVVVFTHGGTALTEAALAARPIVAYDHDWHPDFIGADERGLLARFRDARDLSEKVALLLDYPDLAEKVSKRAYDYASEAFTEEGFIRLQRRIYDKLFRGEIGSNR